MASYIIRRVLAALLVILVVSIFVFSIIHLLPGDPVILALGLEADIQDIERLREEKNLNDPLPTQYIKWVGGIFHGDFGDSLIEFRPVTQIFKDRLPRTLAIGIPAFIIGVLIGVLFGIISAVKRGKFIDQLITLLTTLGIGTPQFWLGMILMYVFAFKLKIFPMRNIILPSVSFPGYLRSAFLPVFCSCIHMIGSCSRQTRSNMLEVISQDYIRTARANGLSEKRVIYKHALKNALIPVVTVVGMNLRSIVAGSVLIENIFTITGLGTTMTGAINNRDYWVLQSCVLLISFFAVFSNLLVDIIYGYIDPRIREARG
ncbi:MAG: ABC transporter permease [Spirochaetales bacterium]|nr:ABC transporter permease [Spirochaetales bacterium]